MTLRGTALVTGASSGIGAAYAAALATAGLDLVLVARRVARLQDAAAAAARAGSSAEVLVADLADPRGLDAVVARVEAGDITVLVNNAGYNGYAPFLLAEPASLAAVDALNVTAPRLLTRAALGPMIAAGSGAVVNVASLLAFSGEVRAPSLPHRATYGAGKAYLVALTRLLAGELVGTGVTVQALCPGVVATEFHDTSGPVDRPAMSADDVVRASLAALGTGELVCAPGLEGPAALEALASAEQRVLADGNRPDLAARYADPTTM